MEKTKKKSDIRFGRVKPNYEKRCPKCGFKTLGECNGYLYCYSSKLCDWHNNPRLKEEEIKREKACFGGEWLNGDSSDE